jgi:hypothetical protein
MLTLGATQGRSETILGHRLASIILDIDGRISLECKKELHAIVMQTSQEGSNLGYYSGGIT